MKTQKFYHLQFVMSNFNYTFGRSVLRDLLGHFFPLPGQTSDPAVIAHLMRTHYPTIEKITLVKLEGEADFIRIEGSDKSTVNLNAYAIKWLIW